MHIAPWTLLAVLLGLWPAFGQAPLRLAFANRTRGALAAQPVYLTVTAQDDAGTFLRMDAGGAFHPCLPADNRVPAAGRLWCAYSFPLPAAVDLDTARDLRGGRIYLSVGAPLRLRVDPATGGLVQPDPANGEDPNGRTLFDWVEFALDRTGLYANTTCVDQFGLPITLEARDRDGTSAGPVGLEARRSDLVRDFAAAVPGPFRALVGDLRITAPGHAPEGPLRRHLDAYIRAMWERYRREPLVLTPDEGTFTGRVEPGGLFVFTRPGDPERYLIRAMPTTPEAFRCDGPLAQGCTLERVLGAQIAAMLNRHILETPSAWRDPSRYYAAEPANAYARFWHLRSLGGKAYAFPYDDVNDQAPLIHAAHPQELRIGFRVD
ncbi:glycoside hydrolase family 64 protein [Mesoterricola silvestris]|uniref:Hydrolase n=1 Tax=Mesoterricola silvestris TaxID=2927979 RepID=A0AA48K9W7_9BACT|nr:beta-1,3-glucanase family protein [Mesoterricola silvestris]BDU72742.1 hydrolase [Mesoterricola silvestris]